MSKEELEQKLQGQGFDEALVFQVTPRTFRVDTGYSLMSKDMLQRACALPGFKWLETTDKHILMLVFKF